MRHLSVFLMNLDEKIINLNEDIAHIERYCKNKLKSSYPPNFPWFQGARFQISLLTARHVKKLGKIIKRTSLSQHKTHVPNEA